jgi:hypothetical protein
MGDDWVRKALFNVEINFNDGCKRVRLTGQDKTGLYFLFIEGIIGFHFNLSFSQLGPASTANATFAGEGQIGAGGKCRIENSLTFPDGHIETHTVEADLCCRYNSI